MNLFPQGCARLLDGPFRAMQEVDHAYLVRLDPDRLLALFLVEAGLEPKAQPYGGWEAPAKPGTVRSLAGHSLGHYLSAISLMYRMTDDHRLKERVQYIARELRECQDRRGDGSLAAFPFARELEADIRAGKVETVDRYWAPFYTIHKELAGLRDAWLCCGDETAREVLRRLADWCGALVKDLPEERRERLLQSEHGGMAEALADAYAILGDRKYLDYARHYAHRAILEPLAEGRDMLADLHANTQIPKVIGFQRIRELAGDESMGAAARFFWKTVVSDHTWINGGNSIHEHFPAPATRGARITEEGGPETCNTYNMLRLTAALYRENPAPELLDYYEGALFNHILTSQAPLPGAGAFVYYTPLRPRFARSYGTDFNSFWCCTGTGMENHARYGELIYAHDDRGVFVNLFIASTLEWSERGFTLRQETRFPEEAATTLVVVAAPVGRLPIRIRHPSWLAAEALRIRVNGRVARVRSQPGGFAELARAWKPGDRIRVELPMAVRVVRQPHCDGWLSLLYGPVLLAGELGSEGLEQRDYIGCYTPARALMPLAQCPVFIAGTDEEILRGLRPVPGRPAAFRTAGIVKPDDVTLSPLYGIHFQRYAVYWQSCGAAEAEDRLRRLAESERDEREREGRTVDRVRVGEQQPETDHGILSEGSFTGVGALGRRWRDARDGGWFSYELRRPAGGRAAIEVLHWNREGERCFEVAADGVTVPPASERGGKDDFVCTAYVLPERAGEGPDRVTVRIQAPPRKWTAAIYDVRVVM